MEEGRTLIVHVAGTLSGAAGAALNIREVRRKVNIGIRSSVKKMYMKGNQSLRYLKYRASALSLAGALRSNFKKGKFLFADEPGTISGRVLSFILGSS